MDSKNWILELHGYQVWQCPINLNLEDQLSVFSQWIFLIKEKLFFRKKVSWQKCEIQDIWERERGESKETYIMFSFWKLGNLGIVMINMEVWRVRQHYICLNISSGRTETPFDKASLIPGASWNDRAGLKRKTCFNEWTKRLWMTRMKVFRHQFSWL